jgi:hypothetical protein
MITITTSNNRLGYYAIGYKINTANANKYFLKLNTIANTSNLAYNKHINISIILQ